MFYLSKIGEVVGSGVGGVVGSTVVGSVVFKVIKFTHTCVRHVPIAFPIIKHNLQYIPRHLVSSESHN